MKACSEKKIEHMGGKKNQRSAQKKLNIKSKAMNKYITE